MKNRFVVLASLASAAIMAFAIACGSETIKEVEVPGKTVVVEKEIIKEVPVIEVVEVEKKVVVEVPGETKVIEKEVVVTETVTKEIAVEVDKEIEVIKVVETEKIVEVPKLKTEYVEVEVVKADASVNSPDVQNPSFVWDGAVPTEFKESPMLTALVTQGKIPPVADRVPDEPLVLRVGERIGDFGGTWRNISENCNGTGGDYRMLHDGVVTLDIDDITPIEQLATSWSSSPDQKNWTVNIRKGVKWSDGAPLTVDDFVFAVENVARNTDLFADKRSNQLSNAGMGSYGGTRGQGDIVKVDDHTFRYEFTNRAGNFPEEFAQRGWWGLSRVSGGFAIYLPSHYLKQFHPDFADAAELEAKISAAGLENWTQLFLRHAKLSNIGTPSVSPWIIKDDTPGQSIWERNPYYMAVDPEGNQLPYIDTLEYGCGEDKEVANLKVMAGEADFHLGADFEKYSLFKANEVDSNYRLLQPKTALHTLISFNQSYEKDTVIQKALRSKDFRVGVSLSIDKPELIDTFLFGAGLPQNISFTADSPFYNDPKIVSLRGLYSVQDKDRANELMDKVFPGKDSDGLRLRGDGGGTFEITLSNVSFASGGMQSDAFIEATAQYIRDVGIRTKLNLVAGSGWWPFLQSNEIQMGGPFGFQGGRVPYTPDIHWAPKMLEWASSDKTAGQAPHNDELLRMFEIFWEAMELPYDERLPLYREAYELLTVPAYLVGIQHGAPNQNAFTVVKNNFRNIPAGWISRYLNGGYAAARPEQFFLIGGKNDAGY